jgi:hypothetical protein
MFLGGVTRIDPDTAAALAEFKGNYLGLPALATLDAATATALAGFKGSTLSLDGLATLSPEAATALAGSRSNELSLRRLASLSPEAAGALEEYAGFIRFPEEVQKDFAARYPLNPDNARTLARVFNGNLSAITVLDSPDSVAVAEALATYKGRLSLPNLKKISPQTLSILIEKEDAIIPLIETLELIPEPDGSPTDDFVIPKGFRERQQVQQKQ